MNKKIFIVFGFLFLISFVQSAILTEDEIELGSQINFYGSKITSVMSDSKLGSLLDSEFSWDDGAGSDYYTYHEEIVVSSVNFIEEEDFDSPALTNERGLLYKYVFDDALNSDSIGEIGAEDFYVTLLGEQMKIEAMTEFSINISGVAYGDGASYIGEDEDQPTWIFEIKNLGSMSGYIGVKYNLRTEDERDSELVYEGDSYVFPNEYVEVKLDSVYEDSGKIYGRVSVATFKEDRWCITDHQCSYIDGEFCSDGICADPEVGNKVLSVCTDSDGGLDYFERGSVVVKKDLSQVGFEDSCIDAYGEAGIELHLAFGYIEESDRDNKNILLEAECLDISDSELEKEVLDFDIRKIVTVYECPNGCEDGKCIEVVVDDDTTDSDDDQNSEEENVNKNKNEVTSQNRKFSIEMNSGGKNIVIFGNRSVATELDVFEESGKLYVVISSGENKEVKFSLEEIFEKTGLNSVDEVEIVEDEGGVIYSVKGTKKGRLFFVFRVTADIEEKFSIENGEIISVKKPWWSFLASRI